MQSTYIQTGILKESSDLSLKSKKGTKRGKHISSVVISDVASVIKNEDEFTDYDSIGGGTVEDFLSKFEVCIGLFEFCRGL